MKTISIDQLIISNFKSFSKETIHFPQTVGLKLLTGSNQTEPRLGANGAGKSSLWEALTWSLYGSGVKGAKTSSVLSWGSSTTSVATYFTISSTRHEIIRTGPPMKIQLDGQNSTQEDIDNLLGLSKDRFIHSVLFGQGVPLFPDLSISERGILLDSVLNLDIWERCSENSSKKVNSLEKILDEQKRELAYITGQLAGIQTEEYIQAQLDYWEENHQDEITSISDELKKWNITKENNLSSIQLQIDAWRESQKEELEKQADSLESYERELLNTEDLINEISQDSFDIDKVEKEYKTKQKWLLEARRKQTELETEKNLIAKPKEFWTNNSTCPTCLQPITYDQKTTQLVNIKTNEQTLFKLLSTVNSNVKELEQQVETINQSLIFIRESKSQREEQIRGYKRDKSRLESLMGGVELSANKLLKQLNEGDNPYTRQYERADKEVNPYILQLDQLIKKINPYIETLANTKKIREELEEKKQIHLNESQKLESSIVAAEYWKHGFKRIRLFFVQQVLAALQIEIQSAISALGLDGWQVLLSTESETKSGTTKLGVQLNIKSPISEGPWESWSGGEAQRLRLSIAMGLGSLIQRSAGSWFTLEIFDEPTSHLSGQGVEDLLEALRYRAESQKKSVWLTDHAALTYSGFKEIWMVEKKTEGSSVYLLNEMEI